MFEPLVGLLTWGYVARKPENKQFQTPDRTTRGLLRK